MSDASGAVAPVPSSPSPSPSTPPTPIPTHPQPKEPPLPAAAKAEGGADSPKSEPKPSQDEFFSEIKINGQTHKLTRQQAIDYAQMGFAANQKFKEASSLKKQVDEIVSRAKSNPIEALMDPALGLSKDQIRKAFEDWYTKEVIEPESLTEEQRLFKETQEKLKRFEEQEAKRLAEEQKQKEEHLTNQQRDFVHKQIIEALETSGLPKTAEIVGRMAFYMRQNLLNGWDAPMELIVRQVKEDRAQMIKHDFSSSTAAQIIELLGEAKMNEIRQYDLKMLREKRKAFSPREDIQPTYMNGHSEKISSAEVDRRLRDMRTGKFRSPS